MSKPRQATGALVLAAGSGSRFGQAKQFLELIDGIRLVDRAVETCQAVAHWVGVVLPEGTTWDGAPIDAETAGGSSRLDSVANGLTLLPAEIEVVVIHDAAHPLATAATADAVIEAVGRGADGAVPVLDAADLVKRRGDDGSLVTVGRDGLGLAQVPMAFDRHVLEVCHEISRTGGRPATDGAATVLEDSALLESLGHRVVSVPGDPGNVHVVDEASLTVARLLAAGGGMTTS